MDWTGLMRLGLRDLGLEPDVFWALTPAELAVITGAGSSAAPLTRVRLEELAQAYPDRVRGREDDN